MAPSLQRLDQIHNPDEYNDSLSGAEVAATEISAETLADHNNALISQIKRILRGDGPGDWKDDPATLGPGGTDASLVTLAARSTLEDRDILTYRLQLTDLDIPTGQNWVVFTVAGNLPPVNIAIADTQQGAVSAQLTGSVGSHSLTLISGLNELHPKNLVRVFDASTGAILKSGNRDIYALLQVGAAATDGNPFATGGNDQGQLSFVRPNAAFTALEAVPVVDIADLSIVYGYTVRDDLQDTPEEAFRADVVGTATTSSWSPHSFLAGCPATLAVGQWAYISGPSVGGRYQVARVDITDFNKLPAIGVVTAKITSTLCMIQWGGEVAGFGALTPRRVYFLQSGGGIGLAPPTNAGDYVQRVGVALDSDVLLVSLNTSLIKRS